MKKSILMYGALAGLFAGGMLWVMWPFHQSGQAQEYGMLIGFASMFLGFSLIFVAVKKFRDNMNQGVISFGKALTIGLLITLVASVVYAVCWELLYNTLASDFVEVYTKNYLTQLKAEGADAIELEAATAEMKSFGDMYANPFTRFGFTLMEIIPVGIVMSLLAALTLKKK